MQIPFAQPIWHKDTPCSPVFKDTYFTPQQGLAESQKIFLEANALPERWHQLKAGDTFTIFETGFGTGLNFLLSLSAWHKYIQARGTAHSHSRTHPRLHFISVEKHPLGATDFQRISTHYPQFTPYVQHIAQRIVQQLYPLVSPGLHSLDFADDFINAKLLLWIGDLQQINQIVLPEPQQIDAWFLDGFAPGKNPAMWTEPLFNYMAEHSAPGATFGTFTAAGAVRRQLISKGFQVHKAKGFGYKRERLYGTWPHTTKQASASKLRNTTKILPTKILIVGGGLSGCLTAHALLQGAGINSKCSLNSESKPPIEITLIEQQNTLAAGASGMAQMALDIKLSSDFNLHTQFYLSAYQHALRYYQAYSSQTQQEPYWHQTGLLHLASNPAEQARQQKLYLKQNPVQALCYPVDQARASELAGLELTVPALYFPHGGYLTPAALCKHLGQQIALYGELITHCTLTQLLWQEQNWLALDQHQQPIGQFDAVVLCNAYQAKTLAQTRFLPLKTIKGQASMIERKPEEHMITPQCVLSNPGNIFPVLHESNQLWLGSSYELHQSSTHLDPKQLKANLNPWADIAPELHKYMRNNFQQNPAQGRAAIRCTTPDYLPVAGRVPIASQYIKDFAQLPNYTKAARAAIHKPVSYYPGLYVNAAHGSRGCCSIPLCAELIANMINQAPLSLSRKLLPYLSAERFIMKDLITKKL